METESGGAAAQDAVGGPGSQCPFVIMQKGEGGALERVEQHVTALRASGHRNPERCTHVDSATNVDVSSSRANAARVEETPIDERPTVDGAGGGLVPTHCVRRADKSSFVGFDDESSSVKEETLQCQEQSSKSRAPVFKKEGPLLTVPLPSRSATRTPLFAASSSFPVLFVFHPTHPS